ncbi:hypothetical protein P691DRAFT_323477 [Macrolepiota fuliginosa MF-IS2]|uniref:Uncharacterized protein n=1 Tax=Macrolepiota fuliginosa MF-IS2 TaxID=1400762 RepID=A0A9P6C0U9_9AGAR|nr:hypothetical protein P691DRAFT_323477 [Macrolepiota fuliginosa MF-IS2]
MKGDYLDASCNVEQAMDITVTTTGPMSPRNAQLVYVYILRACPKYEAHRYHSEQSQIYYTSLVPRAPRTGSLLLLTSLRGSGAFAKTGKGPPERNHFSRCPMPLCNLYCSTIAYLHPHTL